MAVLAVAYEVAAAGAPIIGEPLCPGGPPGGPGPGGPGPGLEPW